MFETGTEAEDCFSFFLVSEVIRPSSHGVVARTPRRRPRGLGSGASSATEASRRRGRPAAIFSRNRRAGPLSSFSSRCARHLGPASSSSRSLGGNGGRSRTCPALRGKRLAASDAPSVLRRLGHALAVRLALLRWLKVHRRLATDRRAMTRQSRPLQQAGRRAERARRRGNPLAELELGGRARAPPHAGRAHRVGRRNRLLGAAGHHYRRHGLFARDDVRLSETPTDDGRERNDDRSRLPYNKRSCF